MLTSEQQNFIIRSMKNNPNFRAFVDGRSELSEESMKDIATGAKWAKPFLNLKKSLSRKGVVFFCMQFLMFDTLDTWDWGVRLRDQKGKSRKSCSKMRRSWRWVFCHRVLFSVLSNSRCFHSEVIEAALVKQLVKDHFQCIHHLWVYQHKMKEKSSSFCPSQSLFFTLLGKIKKHSHLPIIFDLLICVRDTVVFQLAVNWKNMVLRGRTLATLMHWFIFWKIKYI